MRRWNGWGSESVSYTLSDNQAAFLAGKIGSGRPQPDFSLHEYVRLVPHSRLPLHPLIDTSEEARLRHCSGQSLGDWIGLRTGTIPTFPDGVAYPLEEDEIEEILHYASFQNAIVIPYGGGTSVVGHLTSPRSNRPVIVVDLGRRNQLLKLDKEAQLATFETGVRGPDLEAALHAHGYTLGHYPQSFEYSTLGGWIATRSAGHLALHYGRMEQLFAGGVVLTPKGRLEIPPYPASAAGPDLREWVLGSEGRFGILTEATIRVSPLPESQVFKAAFFSNFKQAASCMRKMIQARLPLAMVRLSDAVETEMNLALSPNQGAIVWLNRWLSMHKISSSNCCMMLYGAVGKKASVGRTLHKASEQIHSDGGVTVGKGPGQAWFKGRFHFPYIRNALWEKGFAVDTLETATVWGKVHETKHAIEDALRSGLDAEKEKVHVFTHLSHGYETGSSLYTTYVFRLADTPSATLNHWQKLKTAASEAIVRCGGTISHQHGVGLDHRSYLPLEKGELGMDAIDAVCRIFDPDGLMNVGKLLQRGGFDGAR